MLRHLKDAIDFFSVLRAQATDEVSAARKEEVEELEEAFQIKETAWKELLNDTQRCSLIEDSDIAKVSERYGKVKRWELFMWTPHGEK